MSIGKVENGLLLIGGASRNIGKTSFVCKVISEFSRRYSIVGLKIKTIYEGDTFFHGKDRSPLDEDFKLFEEQDNSSGEDTGKMLRAGAKRAFRLRVKSYALEQAFDCFKKRVSKDDIIICESNSLRKVIKPDLFLLIKHQSEQNMKPSAKELEKFVDRIIITDGEKHDFNTDGLDVVNGRWRLIV